MTNVLIDPFSISDRIKFFCIYIIGILYIRKSLTNVLDSSDQFVNPFH